MSKTNKNALLSVSGRKLMVEMVSIDKETKVAAAMKYNVTPEPLRKWVRRYVSEGESGLEDRFSRPHNSPRATPPEKVQEIVTVRKKEKLTADHIVRESKMHQRTVSRQLIRPKLSRKKKI